MGIPYVGPTPTVANELITKGYVDTALINKRDAIELMPQVGWTAQPQGLNGTAGGVPVFGTLYLTPFRVGYPGWTADAFVVACTTAFTGGTAPVELFGLYPDNGTGFPDTSAGPIGQASLSTASLTTGNKNVLIQVSGTNTPIVLSPALYWIATLATGTAAATAGAFSAIAGAAWEIPLPSTVAVGTVGRGYQLTSQTALPTASLLGNGSLLVNGGSVMPVVGLRRSA